MQGEICSNTRSKADHQQFTNLLLGDNKGLELGLEDSEDISGNPSEASSATNEVVIFKRGTLNILEIRLNTEIETPTAASSTGPCKRGHW